MAKKTLNEAVVRRFQKLANLAPINEMYGKKEEYMKEEEMGMDTEEVDMEMDAEEIPDMKMDDEEAEEAEAGELELTDDEAKSALEAIKDLEELATKLEAAMGELDMDTEEAEEEGEMDMDAMETLEEAEVDSMLEGISYERSEQEIINEVAQRVAKRLQTAKLHEAKLNRALSRK